MWRGKLEGPVGCQSTICGFKFPCDCLPSVPVRSLLCILVSGDLVILCGDGNGDDLSILLWVTGCRKSFEHWELLLGQLSTLCVLPDLPLGHKYPLGTV